MRIYFEAEMFSKPGAKSMKTSSEQYNFFENHTRLFLLKVSKLLIPFHAFHAYRNQEKEMVLRQIW
jgi:hypothetical protein